MPTIMLSPHFSLAEMTYSQTASRQGIPNTPDEAAMEQLKLTCALLEKVRTLLGDKPITINSGYRSPAVNAAVGGSTTSEHMYGRAADFICPGFGTPHDICKKIMSDPSIVYNQLIWEYGDWVHISQSSQPKMQALTINNYGTTSGIA